MIKYQIPLEREREVRHGDVAHDMVLGNNASMHGKESRSR
jgi:hypothetical protein